MALFLVLSILFIFLGVLYLAKIRTNMSLFEITEE